METENTVFESEKTIHDLRKENAELKDEFSEWKSNISEIQQDNIDLSKQVSAQQSAITELCGVLKECLELTQNAEWRAWSRLELDKIEQAKATLEKYNK